MFFSESWVTANCLQIRSTILVGAQFHGNMMLMKRTMPAKRGSWSSIDGNHFQICCWWCISIYMHAGGATIVPMPPCDPRNSTNVYNIGKYLFYSAAFAIATPGGKWQSLLQDGHHDQDICFFFLGQFAMIPLNSTIQIHSPSHCFLKTGLLLVCCFVSNGLAGLASAAQISIDEAEWRQCLSDIFQLVSVASTLLDFGKRSFDNAGRVTLTS